MNRMNYAAAIEALGKRDSRKVGNNTYLQRRDDGAIAVKLHATDVIRFYQDRTVYDSGGWQTVTTKARMNQYGEARIFSDRGIWYLRSRGEDYPFADGITVNANGKVTHAGPPTEKTQKERERVKRFVSDYLKALEAGKVPAPSAGDCWFCSMHVVDGKDKGKALGEATKDKEHILEHIKKRYYVPSLLANALKTMGAAKVSYWYLASFWDESAPEAERVKVRETWKSHFQHSIPRLFRRYLYRQLGLAA